jgi:acyl-CoA synthetase (NDP forming)/GNAT superfamily N-acetyltransferase
MVILDRIDGWDALLADGGLVHIRPVTATDAAALHALHQAASDRSIYLRYFSASRASGDRYVDHLLAAGPGRVALLAERDGAAVGMASCEPIPGTADAEVAFLVADAYQRRGVGTLLLEQLAALARAHGVRRFVAETLLDNPLMLQVFADAGYALDRVDADGVADLAFPIAPTPRAQAAVDARERAADVRSLRHVLAPASVAVVGASDRPGSVGGAVLRNVLAGGFSGPVYVVNRRATTVAGLPAYPSVGDLPEPVDLAVVVVPATEVTEVVADCGQRGVPAAVVVTAGFGEAGADGAARERELLRTARRLGVRLVGPNCLGVACTEPGARLNATFSAVPPVAGSLGFASQSGALGIALLAETARRGIGISGFVSLGNKLDVSGNDLLLYWEDDPGTRVIALYLESFGNPAKFARHAGRIARHKPIVALKAGSSAAGRRAGASHTAAAATPDVIVSALLRKSGVIRAASTAELLDVAQLLGHQPLPAGSRLGVLGNSGGPGILAADAADGCGLTVPELSPATQTALLAAVPQLAGATNPVDLGAAAAPADYERTLGVLLASGEVDAVVAIHAALPMSAPGLVGEAIDRAAAGAAHVPVAATMLGTRTAPTTGTGPGPATGTEASRPAGTAAGPPEGPPAGAVVPVYDFPEAAVRAIGHATRYAAWRREPEGTLPRVPAAEVDAARRVVVAELASRPDGGWLTADRATELLAAFGLPVCPTVQVTSADEAVAVADRLGYPVVVKAGGRVVHKTEVGGVQLNLRSPDAVRQAFGAVTATAEPDAGAIVQPTAAAGVELIVGATRVDPYPPLVLVGLGGTATELLADRAVRLAPLTDTDAAAAVRELRCAPLLLGYRGRPPVDLAALEALLLRVGALADELPELAELDLNPVVASPAGVVAVDVKLRLAPAAPAGALLADPLIRRLR